MFVFLSDLASHCFDCAFVSCVFAYYRGWLSSAKGEGGHNRISSIRSDVVDVWEMQLKA